LKIKIKKNEYHFTTLNKNVELKCLPTGYHSSKAPSNNGCDAVTIVIKGLRLKMNMMA